jgi:hypothetical protein
MPRPSFNANNLGSMNQKGPMPLKMNIGSLNHLTKNSRVTLNQHSTRVPFKISALFAGESNTKVSIYNIQRGPPLGEFKAHPKIA